MIGGRLGRATRGGGRADSGGEDGLRGRCAFAFVLELEFGTFAGDGLFSIELVLETRRFANLRAEDRRRD